MARRSVAATEKVKLKRCKYEKYRQRQSRNTETHRINEQNLNLSEHLQFIVPLPLMDYRRNSYVGSILPQNWLGPGKFGHVAKAAPIGSSDYGEANVQERLRDLTYALVRDSPYPVLSV
jgi:hypothetical protein